MDALLLGATGVLVILLNIFLIPRRQGFQRSYAQRGVWIGVGLVVVAIIRAA